MRRRKRTDARTKKVWKLIEQWARCDAYSRFKPLGKKDGKITDLTYFDSLNRKLELERKIRKVVLGEGDLLRIAHKIGIVKMEKSRKRKLNEKAFERRN